MQSYKASSAMYDLDIALECAYSADTHCKLSLFTVGIASCVNKRVSLSLILSSCSEDVSPACRNMCMEYASGPVYGDLCEFLMPVFDIQQQSLLTTYDKRRSFFAASSLNPLGAWDYRSGSLVPLPRADVDITGTPCVDWSLNNPNRLGLEGPRPQN
jgi:hypothetical protein